MNAIEKPYGAIEECNFKIKYEGTVNIPYCEFKRGGHCDGEENCILFQTYKLFLRMDKPSLIRGWDNATPL